MTDDLCGGIDEAKQIAKRLVQRGRAVEEAICRRDNTLYKLLAHLHRLDHRLRKRDWNEVSKALVAKYGGKPPGRSKSASFLLQLAYPTLKPKTRCHRLPRKQRQIGSFRSFVKQNGGINGCVTKAANLRGRGSFFRKPVYLRKNRQAMPDRDRDPSARG
jgi:hypothetical protein